jgi:hypothetical protein
MVTRLAVTSVVCQTGRPALPDALFSNAENGGFELMRA